MIEYGNLTGGEREFTPTNPLAMEEALRSATASLREQPRGLAIVPYTATFEGDPYYLLLRSYKWGPDLSK